MNFSQRCTWPTSTNPWILRTQSLTMSCELNNTELFDLTENNPTRSGFHYPDSFYRNLGKFNSKEYGPEALGLEKARRAIAQYYRQRNVQCQSDQVFLGSGTSELYSHLLLLLCDPGDCILVPRPGYPLIEILANLHQVHCIPYGLFYENGWSIDRNSILETLANKNTCSGKIRGIVLISPHHPSGHQLSSSELEWLNLICKQNNLSAIVDEVFSEFSLQSKPINSSIEHFPSVLSFALSGLSKAAALPQMKLSWGVCSGPKNQREQAIQRLAILSDNLLSINHAVQLGLSYILSEMPSMNQRICEHIRSNFLLIKQHLLGTPIRLLDCEAGWVALLHLPQIDPVYGSSVSTNTSYQEDLDFGTAWALFLLEKHQLLVQPGQLYDLTGSYLVVSLLTSAEKLQRGLDRLVNAVDQFLRD